jgi:hypothetical protein
MVLPFSDVLSIAAPMSQAVLGQKSEPDLGIGFLNVARESGLNAKTIYGSEHKNKYLLETTGCGVAFYDYDNDGWLDIFLVNGTRLEGFPKGEEPISHLFKNNRDGTFTDVTLKAGLAHSGWGRLSVLAIMTTTVSTICLSPTLEKMCSITTTVMALLQM